MATPMVPQTIEQRLTVSEIIEQNKVVKGIAIIVGNQYSKHYKEILKGPINDLIKMKSVLEALRYAVIPLLNASKQEIREVIRDVSQLYPTSAHDLCYKRIVFIFSGHGNKDHYIHTRDGEVNIINDVIFPLMPSHSPKLHHIPKLIFIDACRGGQPCPGVVVPIPRGGDMRVPNFANYLLVHSTLPTMKAYECDYGGYWMQTLAHELCHPSNMDESIHGVLIKVNSRLNVMLNMAPGSPDLQLAEYHGTLLNDVKFLSEAKELQGKIAIYTCCAHVDKE